MERELAKVIEEEASVLTDEDPRKRLAAVRKVSGLAKQLELKEREKIVGLLEPLTSDKEAFVRWNVAIAVGEIGHPRGIEVLGRLVGDPHANVRFRVALALGLISHEIGTPLLEKMIYDTYEIGGHLVVRAFAAIALGKIGSESAVLPLAKLVEDEDPVVRWHAAVALGDAGAKSGVQHLAKLIEDEIPFVRAHAAIALAQIGDASGLPYLERMAKEESVPRLADICTDALKLCESICEALGERG